MKGGTSQIPSTIGRRVKNMKPSFQLVSQNAIGPMYKTKKTFGFNSKGTTYFAYKFKAAHSPKSLNIGEDVQHLQCLNISPDLIIFRR